MELCSAQQGLSNINECDTVEALLGKRVQNGNVEYLTKRFGKEDTWELAEFLTCIDLIEAFEKEWQRRQDIERKYDSCSDKEADQIIGCTDKLGYLQFLIKWKGLDQADLISAKEAKDKYPKIVTDFYHERLNRI